MGDLLATLQRRLHARGRLSVPKPRLRPQGRRTRALALVLAAALASSAAYAEPQDTMRGLDEQLQELKSDVLAIAAELQQLEEQLLHPSHTQVAVFVAIGADESLELDWLRIRIDGEPVAHHVYAFREVEALRKGGVQRIYTGNLTSGEHGIEVTVAGNGAGGAGFEETSVFSFRKDAEPKVIDLVLGASGLGGARIELGES